MALKYGDIVRLTEEGAIHIFGRANAKDFLNEDFVVEHDAGSYLDLSYEGKVYYCPYKHFIILTGKTIDFGKHPFKEYYQNGLTPHDLPHHTFKPRVLEFINMSFPDKDFFHIHDLQFFWPNVEPDENEFIYIWPNAKAREKGRAGRTKVKPGKFFRMLFKSVTDAEVEWMVERFKEEFAPIECKIFSGTESKDFLHAYTHTRGPDRNFYTTSAYKRMCDSCMKYDKDYWGTEQHPVEAYGSGDWTIFWAEDNGGRIVARCIAHLKEGKYQLGPIYATSQQSLDALKDHLGTLESTVVNCGDWDGAKILRFEDRRGVYGPYFDLHDTLSDKGEYLVLDSEGSIDHCHTAYYDVGARNFCEHCEEHTNLDVTYIESVGINVCESCIVDDFFTNDLDGSLFLNREAVEVYTSATSYQIWAEIQADFYAMWSEHYHIYLESTVAVQAYDDGYIPSWELDNGKWFICTVSDTAYPADEMVNTAEGPVAKENVDKYRCKETDDFFGKDVA